MARNVSDWKAGSAWQHQDYDDAGKVLVVGEVVESAPPRRLVLTWANPRHASDPSRTSRVTFDVEPFMDAVRLTVTHDEVASDPEQFKGISAGWPAVLSSLKTLLETGQPLSMTTRRWGRPAE